MSVPLSFGAASITSDDFLTYPMDGILGLGRSASNIMDYPTAMEAIQATGSIDYNMFGVHLQRNGDGSTDGELSFGAPDSSRYTGELSYTDTDPEGGFWEIPLDDASFDSKPYNFHGKSAILDTGTSFILIPPDDAQRLHAQIPHSEQDGETFNIPCSTDIPLKIIISNTAYNISTDDYVGHPVKDPNLCASNIIGRQAFGPDQWLLGDVFLKNVYAVFDFDKNRVGKYSFEAVNAYLFECWPLRISQSRLTQCHRPWGQGRSSEHNDSLFSNGYIHTIHQQDQYCCHYHHTFGRSKYRSSQDYEHARPCIILASSD